MEEVVFMKEPELAEDSAQNFTKKVIDYVNVARSGTDCSIAVITRGLELIGKPKIYQRFFRPLPWFTVPRIETALRVTAFVVVGGSVVVAGLYAYEMRPDRNITAAHDDEASAKNNGPDDSGGSARESIAPDDENEGEEV